MKFSRDHPGVRIHLDCFRRHAQFKEDYGFRFFSSMLYYQDINILVLGIRKQHYSRNPEVSYNFITLTVLNFRLETEQETQAGRRIRNWSSLVMVTPEFHPKRKGIERTNFICNLSSWSDPPGRVGSGIGKAYELLKVDSKSHQVQFSFKCKQLKVL